MRGLIGFAIVFACCWLIAAFFDLGPRGEIRSFTAIRTTEPNANTPDWLPGNPKSYRISGATIVGNTNGFVAEYDDCAIFSLKDWRCDYSDGSGSFGMQNGAYFMLPTQDDWRVISQFEYHLLTCRWGAVDGALGVFFSCVLSPFFG